MTERILDNPPATLADLQTFDTQTIVLQTPEYRLYFRLKGHYNDPDGPEVIGPGDSVPLTTHANLVRFAWVPRKTLRTAQHILRIRWKGDSQALFLDFEDYSALILWPEDQAIDYAIRRMGTVCYQRHMQVSPSFWIAALAAANHRQNVPSPQISWINVYQQLLMPSWARKSTLRWQDKLTDWPILLLRHGGSEMPYWRDHDTAYLAYTIWRLSAYLWEPEFTIAHLMDSFRRAGPVSGTDSIITPWLEQLALTYFVLHAGRVNALGTFLTVDVSKHYDLNTWYGQMQFHAFPLPKQAYQSIFPDGVLQPMLNLGSETPGFEDLEDSLEVDMDTISAILAEGRANHEQAAADRTYLIELPIEHPFVDRLKIHKLLFWHGYREKEGYAPEEIIFYNFISEAPHGRCFYGVFLPNDPSFIASHKNPALCYRLMLLTISAAWRDLVVVGERVFREPVNRAKRLRAKVEEAARWLGKDPGALAGVDWESLSQQHPELLSGYGNAIRPSEPARTYRGRRQYLPEPIISRPNQPTSPTSQLVVWGSDKEQEVIRRAVKVPGRTRRLPEGRRASKEALERAAAAYVIVPEGKSYWREHWRGLRSSEDIEHEQEIRRIECKGLATLLHAMRRKQ